jgi:hypothetical protein
MPGIELIGLIEYSKIPLKGRFMATKQLFVSFYEQNHNAI